MERELLVIVDSGTSLSLENVANVQARTPIESKECSTMRFLRTATER